MLLRVWSLFGTLVKLLRFAAMFWPLGIDGVIIFLVPGITRLEVVVLEKRTDCSPKRQVAESDNVTRKPSLVSWLRSVSYHCSSINNWKFTFCIVPLFSINNWKFTIKRHLILPNHLTRVQNTCKRLKPVNMSLYTHRHSLFTKQWIPDQKDSPYKHTSLYMYSKRYDKSVFVLIN